MNKSQLGNNSFLYTTYHKQQNHISFLALCKRQTESRNISHIIVCIKTTNGEQKDYRSYLVFGTTYRKQQHYLSHLALGNDVPQAAKPHITCGTWKRHTASSKIMYHIWHLETTYRKQQNHISHLALAYMYVYWFFLSNRPCTSSYISRGSF